MCGFGLRLYYEFINRYPAVLKKGSKYYDKQKIGV